MSYILNISTAVPEFKIDTDNLMSFYSHIYVGTETSPFIQKLSLLNKKTKINTRYSCIPDYMGDEHELFISGNYKPSIEKRMALYKKKIMPLALKAIDNLIIDTRVKPADITHLITVSCTGLLAPGLELMIAEHYGIQHAEKTAINFLGCYAAIKALKQAHYIAQSDSNACVLIVSAELCSLHFYPSDSSEDIIANLLFADGAAAAIICGDKNKLIENKVVLRIKDLGTAYIPGTSGLMTWELSSSAFRMHLSGKVVEAIKENISEVMNNFLEKNIDETNYWAIHPGGIKIVEAVKESLGLNENNIADSISVMQQYGNMSSPTILFILKSIFNNIKSQKDAENKKIVACAFGPGLNVEMLNLISVGTKQPVKHKKAIAHAIQA